MAEWIGILAGLAVLVALVPAGRLRPPDPDRFGSGLYHRLAQRLYQDRLYLTPGHYIALHGGAPVATAAAVGLVTSGSLTAALCAAPSGILLISTFLNGVSRSRIRKLRSHLQEALLSLSASLKAGLALPGALSRCVQDLQRLHRKDSSDILAEFAAVVREIELGTPVDTALAHLRERVPLEEVEAFVDSVLITRQRGGNLVEVIGNVVQMTADKLAMEREIHAVTAAKRLEAVAVPVVPVVLYLLLRVISPGYMEPFFGTAAGQAALGAAFLLTSLAFFAARRIAAVDF